MIVRGVSHDGRKQSTSIYFILVTWAALEISLEGAEQGRDEGKWGKHIGSVGHINVIQVHTGGSWGQG